MVAQTLSWIMIIFSCFASVVPRDARLPRLMATAYRGRVDTSTVSMARMMWACYDRSVVKWMHFLKMVCSNSHDLVPSTVMTKFDLIYEHRRDVR